MLPLRSPPIPSTSTDVPRLLRILITGTPLPDATKRLYTLAGTLWPTRWISTSDNPGPPGNDSVNAAQCLINAGGSGPDNGQDVLAPDATPYTYPFQIQAGSNSALTNSPVLLVAAKSLAVPLSSLCPSMTKIRL